MLESYIEIKREIQDIATDLLAVVTPKECDYTQQPSESSIIYEIDNTIDKLNDLKFKINN